MKRNSLIDLFRFVCAFFVVTIHIHLPGSVFRGVIFPLTRMAVPFFFMVSGYFLADLDAERMKQRLNKQIKTVFWMLAGAMLVYFVFQLVFTAIQNPDGLQKSISVLWNWNKWYRLIAISETRGFYSAHLWYLSALLYGMAIIRLALEYHELKKLYWPAAILGLLLVPLLAWRLGLNDPNAPLAMIRNVVFTGFPCLMTGAWIKCNTQRILKWPRKLVIALPVLFSLLTIGERWLVYWWLGYGSLTTFFNSLLLAASMIVLSIHFPEAGARTPFPKWGAKYSLMIYISHAMIITVLTAAAKSWGFQDAAWYRWSAPFAVFLLAFGFSVLWEGAKGKLKERKQAKAAA